MGPDRATPTRPALEAPTPNIGNRRRCPALAAGALLITSTQRVMSAQLFIIVYFDEVGRDLVMRVLGASLLLFWPAFYKCKPLL